MRSATVGDLAPEVLWTPPLDVRERSVLGSYLSWLERHRGLSFASYDDLWQWSVSDLSGFWGSVWEFFEIEAHEPYTRVLTSDPMPDTKWFPGAKVSYAERALATTGDGPAVVAYSQSGPPRTISCDELRGLVGRVTRGLEDLGVQPGDRVVAVLPNVPETIVAFLACASIGAIFSSCSPEFGPDSLVGRFQQIEPKVMFTSTGYRFRDKWIDRRSTVAQVRAALPTVEAVVEVRVPDAPDQRLPDSIAWDDVGGEVRAPQCRPLPVDHPLYILYSSGTTGHPKALVHGQGLILLEHLKALAFHQDVRAGDCVFTPATTSWVTWNFCISGLLRGATVVCFDGDPTWPDPGTVWRVAAETGTTALTMGASLLLASAKAGVRPIDSFDLDRLSYLGSTGSPLPVEGFRWVYENVKTDVLLASASGGTDVCTGFTGGAMVLPVTAGEMACRYLGTAVDAFDPDGRSVRNREGELVITQPMPSMPVELWNDPEKRRYRSTYFEDYPGVWRHGDWITITDRGTCTISGRSDSTLNRGGVRLGTAEFYEVVDPLPEIDDSLVVHLEDPAGGIGELVLLLAPAAGIRLDEEARNRVVALLRERLSPRHAPDLVLNVPHLPRTLTGKKLEVPVKRILAGEPTDAAVSADAITHADVLPLLQPCLEMERSRRAERAARKVQV